MAEIIANNINVFLENRHVLKNIHLNIAPRKITAIIGPNGSGKSTLLKTLAGLIRPKTGDVKFDNKLIGSFSRKQLSRKISFLMQNPEAPDNISVKELVSLGRFSHQRWFGLGANDHAHITAAIRQVNLEDKRNEQLSTLSGGQQKRAWLAMALAQDSQTILLDEPTAFLDIRHQLDILFLLKKLKLYFGKTIIVVLHDIQQALQFAEELIIMDQGNTVYHHPINANVDIHIIEKIFNICAKLVTIDNETIFSIKPYQRKTYVESSNNV